VRVLLSFNPKDAAFAEAFRASLFMISPEMEIFVSPVLFVEDRPLALKHADALLLFAGPHGLTDRQQQEYATATERSEKNGNFAVVRVLAAGGQVPEWLSRNMTWIEAPVVTDHKMLHQVADALKQNITLTDSSGSKKGSVSRRHPVVRHFARYVSR
jgi:hypothetical protein